MSREKVSTEFDCRRISVVVHRSVSDKLAVVHSSLTRLSCLGLSLIPVKERERVSGRVSNQKRVNLCVAISPSFYSEAPARAKRARSGAPWVRKFGYDVAYARPSVHTLHVSRCQMSQ